VYATSQLSGNTSSVLYSVPPFILGLPKMDMEDCIVYLVWQLRQAGFEVRFTWPNLLLISWKHHESAYLVNSNPIVQAMTPDKPAVKKKAPVPAPAAPRQVAFNQEIDLITRPQTVGVRRAIDYEPPASFIQNMDRPGPGREKKGNVLADLWTV